MCLAYDMFVTALDQPVATKRINDFLLQKRRIPFTLALVVQHA